MRQAPRAPGQGAEAIARQIERAGSGLSYGLWAGLLGAIALATAYLGLLVLVLIPLGVGVLLVPLIMRWTEQLGSLFADRASYALGYRILPPAPLPSSDGYAARFRQILSTPQSFRTAAWLVTMGVTGVLIGSLTIVVVFGFAREVTVPLWWWWLPEGAANSALGLPIDTWGHALSTAATAPLYLVAALWVLPAVAIGQAKLCAAIYGCAPVPVEQKLNHTVEHSEQGQSDDDDDSQVPASQEPPQATRQEAAPTDPRLARLTTRESEVLALIAQGMDNTAIAESLVVSQAAVLKHIRSIFVKLDLPPGESGHRRVRAVLMHLGAEAAAQQQSS